MTAAPVAGKTGQKILKIVFDSGMTLLAISRTSLVVGTFLNDEECQRSN